MIKLKKILCLIFGHRWLYGDNKGIQYQPTLRACKRCGKVERFYGQMTEYTSKWYINRDWYTEERWYAHKVKQEQDAELLKKLTSKGI